MALGFEVYWSTMLFCFPIKGMQITLNGFSYCDKLKNDYDKQRNGNRNESAMELQWYWTDFIEF